MSFGDMLGLGSFITEAMAPYQQHRDAMLRQHDAQGYDTQMYMSRYQLMVQDLMRAGLNPMLAYSQGPGSSPQSPIGQGANFNTDPFGAYARTRVASAQEANINADTVKKVAEAKNTDADTLIKSGMPDLIAQQVVQAKNSAAQSAEMTKKIQVEIPLVQEQIKKITSEIKNTNEDTQLKKQLELTNNYLQTLYIAQQYLTGQQSVHQELENQVLGPKAKASHYWSAEAGERASNMWKIFSPFKSEGLK